MHAAARLPRRACARSATKNGALLIFDEVKTGAKLGWGGASEYFGVKPDMICLAKSIGGGLPLAAFGTHKSVMDLISQHKVFHGGTYNTNPVSMAAGLATFREVLTRENYAHVDKLSKKLTDGYRKIVAKVGLQAYIAQRRREWRADALSARRFATTATGRRSTSTCGGTTGSAWSTAA